MYGTARRTCCFLVLHHLREAMTCLCQVFFKVRWCAMQGAAPRSVQRGEALCHAFRKPPNVTNAGDQLHVHEHPSSCRS